MNSQAFEDLQRKKEFLISLRPIFYSFKETLLRVNKEDHNSFTRLTDMFYVINRKKMQNRHYPEDCPVALTKHGPKYFSVEQRYRLYLNIISCFGHEAFLDVDKIENLEKEIQDIENKMKKIKTLNRNSYILYLLSIKNS